MLSSEDFVDPGPIEIFAQDLARTTGLSFSLVDALCRRGLQSKEEILNFLEPRLSTLTGPHTMSGRKESAERIAQAVRTQEPIVIFGDYDCDGITSTAILTSVLRKLGAQVTPVLATRRDGSYGLSAKALARILEKSPRLVITCDCGSSDHERLLELRRLEIDCIVIDHHLVPTQTLPVLAFLNPHQPGCPFSYKSMASCGLAFSLAAAVRQELKQDLDLRPWLDLVAIGTVADVMILQSDNRALVRAGLQILGQGRRAGLRALAAQGKFELRSPFRAEDIAYKIAPRLNAPGRLQDPDLALELLLTENETEAMGIAARIEQLSLERRRLQDRILEEAIAEINANSYDQDPGLVLGSPNWHPGIVGIVAGRLASQYGKPSIVLGFEGTTGRGSTRGPEGARLHDALTACADVLLGFGGHQAAAGVHLAFDQLDALRKAWNQFWFKQPKLKTGPIEAQVRLDPRDSLPQLVADLEKMEPVGEGNPAVNLWLDEVQVLRSRNIKGHLKLDLRWNQQNLSGFTFQYGELAPQLLGKTIRMIGRLERDSFRGGSNVELRIERIFV